MIVDYDQAKLRKGLLKPLKYKLNLTHHICDEGCFFCANRTANVQNGIFSCVSNVDCPSYLMMATVL